jgi:hypothetical protein
VYTQHHPLLHGFVHYTFSGDYFVYKWVWVAIVGPCCHIKSLCSNRARMQLKTSSRRVASPSMIDRHVLVVIRNEVVILSRHLQLLQTERTPKAVLVLIIAIDFVTFLIPDPMLYITLLVPNYKYRYLTFICSLRRNLSTH